MSTRTMEVNTEEFQMPSIMPEVPGQAKPIAHSRTMRHYSSYGGYRPLALVFREAEREVGGRISINENILLGKPCIAGTRLPVYVILEYLEDGLSIGETASEFPGISEDDVKAALYFAAIVCEQELE